MPRESARVGGALSGDGAGHLVAAPVRKQRLNKSKKELAEEAARVLHQADRIDCVTKGVAPDKFYTLPNRKKKAYSSGSLDRRVKRRGSLELTPPEKPPRTFAASTAPQSTHKTSIFDIFKREKKPEPKKSNLRRSVSDASNLKSKVYGPNHVQPLRKRSGSDEELASGSRNPKKQLSPIIEVTQREDYFSQADPDHDKENVNDENLDIRSPARKKNKKESVTDQLKEYIDEVDAALYKETGIRVSPPKEEVKSPQPIIIDVDKAEKISEKNKKFKDSLIGKKLKSITHKKNKSNEAKSKAKKSSTKNRTADTKSKSENQAKPEVKEEEEKPTQEEKPFSGPISASPKIKEAVENFEKLNKASPTMIHSSQKPVDKLPLTKGRTVNSMIKQLSSDSRSPPPPRTSVLITPHGSVQHNNNQPFSYTRGISPEKYMSNENLPNPTSPIIYAQVVCGSNGAGQPKQTVHTAYTNGKKHPNSDSDEGLGGEENSGFSRLEKTVTHFGDNSYNDDGYRKKHLDDYFDEDKFEEESPITPKFRSPTYLNGFSGYERKLSEFSRIEQSGYIDSSSRGRGDGMDAKRRESLTENENGFIAKTPNGRSDLSARRDLLESRIKNRLTDKIRTSPEYTQNTTPTNVYISESTSKYYRGDSASPIGYTEKYVSETKTDKYGKPQKYESRSKQYFGDRKDSIEYELRGKPNTYQYNGFDSEPKSFDSQISDYRSSPENRHFESSHNKSNGRYVERTEKQKMFKDREVYKSTPEIHQRSYQETKYHDSYHDSLRRDKMENRMTSSSKYKSERYLDQSENERKDKFGDSGIENDFRRDSGENFRVTRPPKSRREYCNDSEDEGFASSLLIASERQHTEDSINQRKRKDYDSDRTYSREDDSYRHLESMDYKSKIRNQEYVPRERSIDDGSHYDPRIDKEVDRSTLKRVDKKPPKPEKKSGLEKVKSLFTRDSKKKKEKQQAAMVREESLRARYVEYKGRDTVDAKYKKKEANEVQTSYDYSNRRRLSTPSPSPTRETQRNGKSEATHGSWFKSLDRLSRKKTKKDEKEGNVTSGTEEEPSPAKPTPTKSLRFFGDTDIESNDSVRHKSALKTRPGIAGRTRSQSTRDLHNISEELRTPEMSARRSGHKSMLNISEADRDVKGSRTSLKPPASPNHRATRDASRGREDRTRRRKNEVSSVESSTEGDSSQQSQRSVVYLHAATVGDIPGPGYLRNGRRAASREELASNSSSRMQPQVKTLSRSFSVLAPWKPRHPREAMDIDYTQYPKPTKNGKYEQKVSKNTSSRKDNSSTLKKKAQETRKNNNSTLNRKSKSKENVSSQTLRSREELSRGSNSTLYKKKERLPRENSRYNRDREDKKMSSKSLSVESLGTNGRNGKKSREESSRDISRSVSMPRDPEKSAGWFKMKKSKISGSTQRL